MMTFNEFNLNENLHSSLVKRGESVKVILSYLQGKPDAEVVAYTDSSFNEYLQQESFSFLFGGDMMMIARWDGEKWYSE